MWAWLNELVFCEGSPLAVGTRRALLTLLGGLERERDRLDRSLVSLASASRYQDLVSSLTQIPGIGLLTALV